MCSQQRWRLGLREPDVVLWSNNAGWTLLEAERTSTSQNIFKNISFPVILAIKMKDKQLCFGYLNLGPWGKFTTGLLVDA